MGVTSKNSFRKPKEESHEGLEERNIGCNKQKFIQKAQKREPQGLAGVEYWAYQAKIYSESPKKRVPKACRSGILGITSQKAQKSP